MFFVWNLRIEREGIFFYFNYDYSEWVPNFLNDDFVIFLFFFNKNFSVKHQIVLKSDFS